MGPARARPLLRKPDAGDRPDFLRGAALRRRRHRQGARRRPRRRAGVGKTAPAERAAILNKIADRIDANREALALAEVWDNGKPIREALAADIPLAADHFRYFAGAIRAQEGTLSQIDEDTVAYHFHEPLGVVGQIIPWNFPILMASWKLAPALAAGNAAVLKPAEQTPASVLYLMSLIADLLPPAWSTSSTGSAPRPASRWRRATASPRWRSPGRPPPGG
ncbi:aldehyde dehydrogenase family protein [Mycobacterium xenopi 3993]|nr:aldehyde dehydrogenase family protein [Mycobacterium xenopi 3993]